MKYSITNDTITVIIDGDVQTIHADMPMFDSVRNALFRGDYASVGDLISPAKAINAWSKGDFKVVNGAIKYKEESLPNSLDRRILQMIKEGNDPSALTNFWEKLQQNPSRRSVEQLFTFLVHEGIPLTPEGDFLAYKSVRTDYKDHHSNSVSNTVGTTNEMLRNKISDDPNEACHYGFHVGALAYAQEFHGGNNVLVICRVNPADVVCVPYDCNAQKVRVCRYEVVGNYGAQLPSTVFKEDEEDRPNDDSDVIPTSWDPDAYADEDDSEEDDDYAYNDEDEDDDYSYDDEIDEDEETHKELEDKTLEELRRYATRDLNIVGASRILGGKAALIERIRKVRGF